MCSVAHWGDLGRYSKVSSSGLQTWPVSRHQRGCFTRNMALCFPPKCGLFAVALASSTPKVCLQPPFTRSRRSWVKSPGPLWAGVRQLVLRSFAHPTCLSAYYVPVTIPGPAKSLSLRGPRATLFPVLSLSTWCGSLCMCMLTRGGGLGAPKHKNQLVTPSLATEVQGVGTGVGWGREELCPLWTSGEPAKPC